MLDVGVLLRFPQPGMGKFHAREKIRSLCWRVLAMLTGAQTKVIDAVRAGMHMINGAFM